MYRPTFKSAFIASTLAACSLVLSGCFLTPGQFEAKMDIRQSGAFSFTYDGEIVITAMSDLAEMADAAEMQEDCYDEDTYESRPCTKAELEDRAAEQEQERAMMQAMMGSSDMSDPESAEEFAADLERQAGWNSVAHLGDGVFLVDFAIASRITHDFTFPTIEQSPIESAFVKATLRDDDRLRIDAPGFAVQSGNPMQAMMMGGMAAMGEGASEQASTPNPDMPEMRGTFTITTDASILANNTEEGPSPSAGGQDLVWKIEPSNTVAPTALIRIQP